MGELRGGAAASIGHRRCTHASRGRATLVASPLGLVRLTATPWRTVGRWLGQVIFTSSPPLLPSFSWGCSTATSTCSGPANPWMSLTGALCSLPLVALVLFFVGLV